MTQSSNYTSSNSYQCDVFISHESESSNDFFRMI